ncbi:MAG: N-acetyltransferase [Tepidisphaeraceae bacterium]
MGLADGLILRAEFVERHDARDGGDACPARQSGEGVADRAGSAGAEPHVAGIRSFALSLIKIPMPQRDRPSPATNLSRVTIWHGDGCPPMAQLPVSYIARRTERLDHSKRDDEAVGLDRARSRIQRHAMVTIRPETVRDVELIHDVLVECFPTDAEAKLVEALRDAGVLKLSFVAHVGQKMVGHIAFSPVTTDDGATGLGLSPLSVVEAHQHQGVGSELVEAGLAACQAQRAGWVVVLGDPRFYGRFGFKPAMQFGLIDEFNGGGAFQALELIPGKLPRGAGVVRYAPQFAELV